MTFKKLPSILTLISLLLLWFVTLKQLSLEWSVNTLYNYGWWVPVLGLYLLWERSQKSPTADTQSKLPVTISSLFVILSVCYLPLRIFQEANQDWIFINWTLTILTVCITFITLYSLGGMKWVTHFGFPFFFIFTAVPWPVVIENGILQNLMQFNAAFTAEVLTLSGHIAIAQGNIIFVDGQYINVDDACSGIRSLQTSFMMSLFLGEFYRLNGFKRIALMLSSFAVAFMINLGRTFALSFIGATQGKDALVGWHDPLGYVALFIGLGSLWFLSYLFSKNNSEKSQKEEAYTAISLSTFKTLKYSTFMPALLLSTLAIAEVTTELWYRSKESALIDSVDWNIEWPSGVKDFKEQPFSEITETILKFNEGKSASWTTHNGNDWNMYLLEWKAGRVSKSLAGAHSPEVCFPASGFKLHSFLGIRNVEVDNLTLPFRAYLFKDGSNSYFYVFHCIWENKHIEGKALLDTQSLSRKGRVDAVLSGKRNLGQKVMGISLKGPSSLDFALMELQHMLKKTLTVPAEEEQN